jgi:hypothetical protein
MPVQHDFVSQAAECAEDHSTSSRLCTSRTASFFQHAPVTPLLMLTHFTFLSLLLIKSASSIIVPIDPFIGTPIITDYVPLFSTPTDPPVEIVMLSNQVMRVSSRRQPCQPRAFFVTDDVVVSVHVLVPVVVSQKSPSRLYNYIHCHVILH